MLGLGTAPGMKLADAWARPVAQDRSPLLRLRRFPQRPGNLRPGEAAAVPTPRLSASPEAAARRALDTLEAKLQNQNSNTVKRLDQALVERGLCESREKAKRAIMAGLVRVDGQLARKPSDVIRPGNRLALDAPEPFVSRGGLKLDHALSHFQLDARGQTFIDLGASTGGFTDCLLQRGAARIYAVDVGRGQLAWKLRRDPRVVVMDKMNARLLVPARFPQPFESADGVVIDCSFISLRKILPPAIALLRPCGKIIALIKPQFEAGKAEADRGAGVIRDPRVHERVLRELSEFVAAQAGLRWCGVTESPVLGAAGNKEFLVLIEKTG